MAYEERQDEASFLRAHEVVEHQLAIGENARLHVDHGYLQEVRGRVAIREALRSYERALALDPAFERAHSQRIQALAALGQAHDAVRVYERRLSDEPHSVGAHRCLAPAYVAAGAFEQAAGVVDRGRDLGPDAGLLDLRGDALACQGRSEDALATWS